MDRLKQIEKEIADIGYSNALAKIYLKLEEISKEQSELKNLFEQLNDEFNNQSFYIEDTILETLKNGFQEDFMDQMATILQEHEKNIHDSCKKISTVFLMSLKKYKDQEKADSV